MKDVDEIAWEEESAEFGVVVDTVKTSSNGSDSIELEYEFVVPGKEEKGYLKRMRAALRFKWLIESGFVDVDYRDMDELVEFLAQYFRGVSNQEAREVLWDLSEQDFLPMIQAILGQNQPESEDNPNPPKEN